MEADYKIDGGIQKRQDNCLFECGSRDGHGDTEHRN